MDSLLDSPDTPARRVVSLPHLRLLRISAEAPHPVLLNHLHIPIGASVTLEFDYDCERSPFLDYLPRTPDDLDNVSHITSVNLNFCSTTALRLEGPSGGFYVIGTKDDEDPAAGEQTFQALNMFHLLATEQLAITHYNTLVYSNADGYLYQTFLVMENLRTITLTRCFNPPILSALDPNQNSANTVACPKLEELILFTENTCMEELLEMAKWRAAKGARLSLITVTCPREFAPAEERVSELRNYASRVECRLDGMAPNWYAIPGEVVEVDHPRTWWRA